MSDTPIVWLGINWSPRLKNPTFWLSILLGLGSTILTYFNLSAADITTWPMLWNTFVDAVSNPYVVFSMIMYVITAAIDPTTSGITDSRQAKNYTKPKKENSIWQ